jgi:hypothetical protein
MAFLVVLLCPVLEADMLQAYTAPQQAGYAGRLITARMDVPRFRKVNTAKGPWRLLDTLATAPRGTGPPPSSGAAAPAASSINAVGAPVAPAAGQGGSVEGGSSMQLEDVRRIVRAVAVDIVGEEALEGGDHDQHSHCEKRILMRLIVPLCSTTW